MTDNTMHLDRDQVLRELPPVPPGGGSAPPPPGGPASSTSSPPADAAAAWGPVAEAVVDIGVKGLVAPNWTIEDPPRRNLIEAVAGVLNDLMPGGMGNVDAWGPYGKLAFAAGAVALANFDLETLTFKPMQKRARKPAPTGKQAGADQPHDPDVPVNYRGKKSADAGEPEGATDE